MTARMGSPPPSRLHQPPYQSWGLLSAEIEILSHCLSVEIVNAFQDKTTNANDKEHWEQTDGICGALRTNLSFKDNDILDTKITTLRQKYVIANVPL